MILNMANYILFNPISDTLCWRLIIVGILNLLLKNHRYLLILLDLATIVGALEIGTIPVLIPLLLRQCHRVDGRTNHNEDRMTVALSPLPYAKDALAPHVS